MQDDCTKKTLAPITLFMNFYYVHICLLHLTFLKLAEINKRFLLLREVLVSQIIFVLLSFYTHKKMQNAGTNWCKLCEWSHKYLVL